MIDHAQFDNLPVIEKLRLVTSLWNQIANSGKLNLVRDEVVDDAERRIEEMIAEPNDCLTEEDMWRLADEIR